MACYEPDLERLQLAHNMLAFDPIGGVRELESLSALGSTLAPLYLGWACQNGSGTSQDDKLAKQWFAVALARGDATSSYYLGHLHLKLAQYREASDAFEQGLELGYAPSIYCLAMNILEGKGREKNEDRAIQLLESSSDLGHVFARRSLASAYLSGRFGGSKFVLGIWLLADSIAKGVYLSIRNADSDRLRA